ncbi:hypothetical protein PQR14_32195 [Paraburkholderia bryophila]|uniref:hypothetical protein n=1 Tax=Paraburkholderia bryophila TaxID=420952 RepID=UPI0038BB972A
MQELKNQLEIAKLAYAHALTRLAQARDAYQNGPGKSYAEVLGSAGEFAERVAEQNEAHEDAKTALADAMLKSRGKITSEVKTSLAARRDADDMLEQLEILKLQMERNRTQVHIDASTAARAYISAYEEASQHWSEMNVLEALVECGERIGRAMAVVPTDELLIPWRLNTGRSKTICHERMLTELKRLRDAFSGDASAYTRDIGQLDLGALPLNEILTNAAAVMAGSKLKTTAL